MAEEIGFENGRNSNFEGLVTLTLTLDPVIRHTVVHHSSTSTYIPNFIEIEETFCGRTYGRTFPPPLILLGRLSEVDLKRGFLRKCHKQISRPFSWLPSNFTTLSEPSFSSITTSHCSNYGCKDVTCKSVTDFQINHRQRSSAALW